MAIAVLNLSGKTILQIVDKIRIVIIKMTGNPVYFLSLPFQGLINFENTN